MKATPIVGIACEMHRLSTSPMSYLGTLALSQQTLKRHSLKPLLLGIRADNVPVVTMYLLGGTLTTRMQV